VAVHRLTRGIGDTMFYGADGQPWFRLDEQRHDVSLDDISADLQRIGASTTTPASIRSDSDARLCATSGTAAASRAAAR
jgi:hypothetical protein